MNIDVLLTDGQQSQAIQQGAKGWFAALNTLAGNEFLESIADSLCKAQCLKLLGWQKKDCLHGLVGVKRGKCSECMSELESKLKEAGNGNS